MATTLVSLRKDVVVINGIITVLPSNNSFWVYFLNFIDEVKKVYPEAVVTGKHGYDAVNYDYVLSQGN